MSTTSVRKRGSILGSAAAVAGVILSMSAGSTASAQNLLGNASFERSFAAVDFNDLIAGNTTLIGPHAGLTPWFVPAGTDVEHYFRRADGALSIARVPHGECVIGMDFDAGSGTLGKIEQGFSAPYPKSTVPFYVMVGDFAGDRGKGDAPNFDMPRGTHTEIFDVIGDHNADGEPFIVDITSTVSEQARGWSSALFPAKSKQSAEQSEHTATAPPEAAAPAMAAVSSAACRWVLALE